MTARKLNDEPDRRVTKHTNWSTRLAGGLLASWLLGLIIGPFMGYFLTGIGGWVDLENWRTWMLCRVGICLGWPMGSALLLGLVTRLADGGRDWKPRNTLGQIIVSLVGLIPAQNAIRDLANGYTIAMPVVTAKHLEEVDPIKSRPYPVYSVNLEDGRSYFVDAETFAACTVGQRCKTAYLLHTDILLAVLPPDPVRP